MFHLHDVPVTGCGIIPVLVLPLMCFKTSWKLLYGTQMFGSTSIAVELSYNTTIIQVRITCTHMTSWVNAPDTTERNTIRPLRRFPIWTPRKQWDNNVVVLQLNDVTANIYTPDIWHATFLQTAIWSCEVLDTTTWTNEIGVQISGVFKEEYICKFIDHSSVES